MLKLLKNQAESQKTDLLKMPQEAFSVGVRYHDLRGILPRSQAFRWCGGARCRLA
jgi:hypothetical protein